MTFRQIFEKHPDWIDKEMVVYANGNGDYVHFGEYDGKGLRGFIYEADEMQDVAGKDCEPTGRKLVVFDIS